MRGKDSCGLKDFHDTMQLQVYCSISGFVAIAGLMVNGMHCCCCCDIEMDILIGFDIFLVLYGISWIITGSIILLNLSDECQNSSYGVGTLCTVLGQVIITTNRIQSVFTLKSMLRMSYDAWRHYRGGPLIQGPLLDSVHEEETGTMGNVGSGMIGK